MHDYYLQLEEVSDWVTECLSIRKNESSYEKVNNLCTQLSNMPYH